RTRFANANANPSHLARRQTVLELRPGLGAVDRLVDPGLGAGRQEAVLALQRRRVEDVGVRRIHHELREARVLADLFGVRPCLAAVGGLVEATLAARRPQRAE